MNAETLVVVGIAAMLLLIISFLLAFNISQRKKFQYRQEVQHLHEQQQNQLIEAAVRSEETERHRISEELHDEVGALLSATKLYLGYINAEMLPKTEADVYQKTKALLDDSIEKVRTISHNLHSAILKELGLNEAIKSFMQKIGQAANLHTSTQLDDEYARYNADNDISIYRIMQELCNNILKHAKPSLIEVKSTVENNLLSITISHNGNGLSQQEFETLRYQKNGLGLKNIQNRIILLKGKITFESAPQNNFILLQIPVKPAL